VSGAATEGDTAPEEDAAISDGAAATVAEIGAGMTTSDCAATTSNGSALKYGMAMVIEAAGAKTEARA
jgi:hypothetical protein